MHPRDDLRAAQDWWRNDTNFRPILPLPLAARLRPWAYGAGIALVLLGVCLLLPVTLGPVADWLRAAGLFGALGVLASRVMRWCAEREAAQYRQIIADMRDYAAAHAGRPAATGETVRLEEVEA